MSKIDDPQLYDSGYERNRLDRYWTNPWMVKALVAELSAVRFDIPGPIWEPAAGRGDLSNALIECNHEVYPSDIDMSEFPGWEANIEDHDWSKCSTPGGSHQNSFLDEFEPPVYWNNHDKGISTPVRSIVTNPPYNVPRGIADAFIRHGLGFFDGDVQFMAMLLRSEFRCGKSRADMFGNCPHYMGEMVLTTRPRWDYGDPDAPETAAPRHNFSWFLWHKDYRLQHGGSYLTPPLQIFSYMPRGFKP